ncbi:hypothetical protein P153DRAFT_375809 [Dothidotthia symphoricarpi CBS 119687]|uniref:Hemerythrin-like domain-containing protein n=1 Tax=Dothidotthia symphoricarpi CBS 119687 TaxID=1392245 RepID=A0A6A6ABZ0_9PLEO|nr:uncharacterized protein P153DRAFT_375809 [Dothidotthia symphoricarpi CBS 119687]KAF2129300.1 hypothetical protein P153DRAFT_375809 [Dothidotthia symphoricarpi CBS 119687]
MASSVPENTAAASAAAASAEAPPLPKLNAAEFRQYNRLAEHMDYFHTHFRSTYNTLYTACTTQKRPAGMSIRSFLALGEQFCAQLTMHHTIEEQHVFPVLARKMPAFRKELELLEQHKEIHRGLDRLEEYLRECRVGERELRLGELKGVFDGFGGVLWRHLDEEVEQLGAENMRRFWTLEEMERLRL